MQTEFKVANNTYRLVKVQMATTDETTNTKYHLRRRFRRTSTANEYIWETDMVFETRQEALRFIKRFIEFDGHIKETVVDIDEDIMRW